jgi:rubrerythrin
VVRIEAEFLESLDDEGRRAAVATVDLDSDENQCPACGDTLTSIPGECPGCGLRLG